MINICLLYEDQTRVPAIEQELKSRGYTLTSSCTLCARASTRIAEEHPDTLLIQSGHPQQQTLACVEAIMKAYPMPILLYCHRCEREWIHKLVQADLSGLVINDSNYQGIVEEMEIAVARFVRLRALHKKIKETETKLAERIIIEKAKGVLMERTKINEESAYRYLRQTAMDQNKRIIDIARKVLKLQDNMN